MELSTEELEGRFSELTVSTRRALVDHLRATIADLAYDLAVDGLSDLIPPMLVINDALGGLMDEISKADTSYSDEIILATVRLIRTSRALLTEEVAVQTIH
ncbi:hypothetical protein RHSP_37915 [Rhizobium freirei PRF 81]|uniref:Uncharacterized protein n=1 Tax=Rhizobium freirei PRF 81 TaxID=363754 RepID=N6VCP5_9HYPH|nr:hypothetical protein [Rhizobium freirei]ENN88832.1 hypothetical protein RHSP_37915 [Rhizobium freirei PRF 81]